MENQIFNCSLSDVRSTAKRMKTTLSQTIGDSRTPVLVGPSLSEETLTYDGMNFSRTYLDLMLVILALELTEYFREWTEYLQYDLEQYLERNLLYPELRAMLVNQDIAAFIVLSQYQKKYSEHALFSLLSDRNRVLQAIRSVRLKIIHPRKIKELVRRRGYKDKGTLRRPDCVLEKFDYSFVEEQQRIEEKRVRYHAEVDLIVEMVAGMVLDTHQD